MIDGAECHFLSISAKQDIRCLGAFITNMQVPSLEESCKQCTKCIMVFIFMMILFIMNKDTNNIFPNLKGQYFFRVLCNACDVQQACPVVDHLFILISFKPYEENN